MVCVASVGISLSGSRRVPEGTTAALLAQKGPFRLSTRMKGDLRRWGRICRRAGARVAMPLGAGGRMVGAILLGDRFLNAEYGEDDFALLDALGRHLAVTIYSQSLVDEVGASNFQLNRKVVELETLYQAGLNLGSSLEASNVIEEVLALAVGVVDARAGFLLLKDRVGGRLRLVNQVGCEGREGLFEDASLRRRMYRVTREESPVRLTPDQLPKGLAEAGALIAPLGTVGCIGVVDKETRSGVEAFSVAEAQLLELMGQQAGAALVNAQLYQDMLGVKVQNENILSSVGNGVLSTDLRGRVIQYNPAVERIFGDNLNLNARSCSAFLKDQGCVETARAVLASLKDGESRIVEGERVADRGIVLNGRISPLKNDEGTVAGVVVALEDLSEEMRLRSMFKAYVSDQVVDAMVEGDGMPSLGGEERDVTVLCADIRKSTNLLTRIGAEEMVSLLNDCFTRLNELIFENDGTLDKYMGDGFMVVYGAPLSHEDDTERAVRTAVAMRDEVARFNRGKPEPVPLAFGMSRGRVVAGNVGSIRRMEYTCIGPAVVQAARLCDAAAAGQILVDDSIEQTVGGRFSFEDAGWRSLAGVGNIQTHWVVGEGTRKRSRQAVNEKETSPSVDLSIPMLPEMELAATKTAEAVATFMELTQDQTEEIKLAMIEACINAFEHSQSKDQKVRINFEIGDDALTIHIADSGEGFDPDDTKKSVEARRASGESKRGWGLLIMEELMDEVKIESGSAGTSITMVKNR